jgi:pimeloyl-ACP methyl ester carboxylesterase
MQLATRTHGNGPRRIAMVHGLGVDASTWEPLIDEILAHVDATIIAPDLRGHGASARSDAYSLEAFASDLVETLPRGLDLVVGHSLGGSVLKVAVARLAPAHALYLDPGFKLGLPSTGLISRLFWAASPVTLTVAAAFAARSNGTARESYPERSQQLIREAQSRFDKRIAATVFKDVTFHPVSVAQPEVPSTIVLSVQSKSVLPDALAVELQGFGWDVRRLANVRHDMQLQDPAATFAIARDVFAG